MLGQRRKTILASRLKHVNPANIHLAHCITADVSQGSEYRVVVGLFHDNCVRDAWIGKSRVYVMASRAQEAFIALGKHVLNSFNILTARMEPNRHSYLRQMLREHAWSPSEVPRVSLEQMKDMTDRSQSILYTGEMPCVPVAK